nr:copia protein [Tanacetum cinerariifolium]
MTLRDALNEDPSKVTDIELTAHMIAIKNQRDSVSPPPLAAKPKKGKSQTGTSTLPKSQGPEALGALFKKSKRPKSKKSPTETMVTLPKPTKGSEQSYSARLKPCHVLRGHVGTKTQGGNKPPADIELQNPTDADLSRTGAKYQEDQTHSSRLRMRLRKVKKTFKELDKEEEIKKAEEEARINVISKTKVIKVVCEEAKKLGIHLKEAIITKASELFKKAQDAEHEVLKRQHTKKKKNAVVKDLMNSIIQSHERLRKIHRELGIQSAHPALEQAPSQTLGRKQKHMELEPETRILGLECNRALPENVSFVNNMVIEEPEYESFFTNEFGDQAFERWSDIDKVRMESLMLYLVAGSMVKSPENE